MIETLVVLAIIILSIAILAPAIQKSRGQRNRNICMLNLRMIGLAMHNYYDTLIVFPPGWVAHDATPENGPRFGWPSMMLLMLDQREVMDQIFDDRGFDKPMQTMHVGDPRDGSHYLQTDIDVFRCPADTTDKTNPIRGNYGTSNYSGNHGDQSLPRWVAGRRGVAWPGQVETPRKPNGIFYWNSSVRERDVSDGYSNTIFVGERCSTSAAGIWPGVGSNEFENDAVTDCSHLSQLNQGPTSFSSLHPGGAYFLFGDGTVRFINQFVDSRPSSEGELGIYQRLGNRHDGLPVVDDF
jgi:hypothetical protein